MGRKELEELISGFWEFQILKVATEGDKPIGIDELMYEYLLSRNDQQNELAIEDGYNMQDACSRYNHIIHIKLFTAILNGDLNETVYSNWISVQVSLMEKFRNENEVSNYIIM